MHPLEQLLLQQNGVESRPEGLAFQHAKLLLSKLFWELSEGQNISQISYYHEVELSDLSRLLQALAVELNDDKRT